MTGAAMPDGHASGVSRVAGEQNGGGVAHYTEVIVVEDDAACWRSEIVLLSTIPLTSLN